MSDDLDLLRRYVRDRSESAFASLVRQQLPLVYFTALRRTNGDPHLAEDVTQIVFAALAREAKAVCRHPVLTGWLFVTTRHAAANVMRSEQRRKTREQEAPPMQELPEPETDVVQIRAEIDPVLEELSETDRNAVLMRFFENRTYEEIGASLRLSTDAARRRVDRALEKMRGLLGRRGIVSTAAALSGALTAQGALSVPTGLAATITGAALTAGTTATVTAGSTLTIFGFMTTNKIVFGFLGAVTFLAAGSVVHENRQKRMIAAELTDVNRQRETLASELKGQTEQTRQAREKLKFSELRSAMLEKREKKTSSNGESGATTVNADASGTKQAVPASSKNRMEIGYDNPEYAKLDLELTAMNLSLRFGAFYRQAGLSSAQVHAFEQLMIEQHQAMQDVVIAAHASGVSVYDPGTRGLTTTDDRTLEAQLKGVLGTDGYSAYQAFSKTSSARNSVDALASKLYSTNTPVTAAQADKLAGIIAANTPKATGGGFFRAAGSPDWPTIYSQAKEVLSEEQIATFQKVNESRRLSLQQSALMDKLLLEEAAKSPKN